MAYDEQTQAEINILKNRICPDCGGRVLILDAEPNRQYPLFWRCIECKGEAGISAGAVAILNIDPLAIALRNLVAAAEPFTKMGSLGIPDESELLYLKTAVTAAKGALK